MDVPGGRKRGPPAPQAALSPRPHGAWGPRTPPRRGDRAPGILGGMSPPTLPRRFAEAFDLHGSDDSGSFPVDSLDASSDDRSPAAAPRLRGATARSLDATSVSFELRPHSIDAGSPRIRLGRLMSSSSEAGGLARSPQPRVLGGSLDMVAAPPMARTPRRRKRRAAAKREPLWAAYLVAGVNLTARSGSSGLRAQARGRDNGRRRNGRAKASASPGQASAGPSRWATYLTCGVVELLQTFPQHVPAGVARHMLDFIAGDAAALVNLAAVNVAFRCLCREPRFWRRLDLSNRSLTDGYLRRLLRVAPIQHVDTLNLANLTKPSARRGAAASHASPRVLKRTLSVSASAEARPHDLTLVPLAEMAAKLFPTLGVDLTASAPAPLGPLARREKLRMRLRAGLRLREVDLSGNEVVQAEALCGLLARSRNLRTLQLFSVDQVVNDEKLPMLTRALQAAGSRVRNLRLGTRTTHTQMMMKHQKRLSDAACAAFLSGEGIGGGFVRLREEEMADEGDIDSLRQLHQALGRVGLESLSLHNQTLVSSRTVHAITQTYSARTLRDLDLSSCSRITDEMLEALVTTLPRLEVLDLSNCWKLTDLGLRSLRTQPPLARTLTTLRLSGCSFVSGGALAAAAADLPVLAHVAAARMPHLSDAHVRALGAALGDRARTLDLSHCDRITRHGATALCLACPGLESLVLAKCAGLHGAFLRDVQELLARGSVAAFLASLTEARDGDEGGEAGRNAGPLDEHGGNAGDRGLTVPERPLSGLASLLRSAPEESTGERFPLASLVHLNLREVRGFDDACLGALLDIKTSAAAEGRRGVAGLQRLLVGGTLYKSENWDFRDDEKDCAADGGEATPGTPRAHAGLSDAAMRMLARHAYAGGSLEVLDLEGHNGVTDPGVLELAAAAPRMRLLRLNGLRGLTDAFVDAMMSPCHFVTPAGCGRTILPMPRLSELHIGWCPALSAPKVCALRKARPDVQLATMNGRKLIPHHQQ